MEHNHIHVSNEGINYQHRLCEYPKLAEKEYMLNEEFDHQASFLGPSLWNKQRMQIEYKELDEILHEHGLIIPSQENDKNEVKEDEKKPNSADSELNKVEHNSSSQHDKLEVKIPKDLETTPLPLNELKPQPIIRKAKKMLIPESVKDNRYWTKRVRNNISAKRSREARRAKENQITLRARFLEQENVRLKVDIKQLKEENKNLHIRIRSLLN